MVMVMSDAIRVDLLQGEYNVHSLCILRTLVTPMFTQSIQKMLGLGMTAHYQYFMDATISILGSSWRDCMRGDGGF